MCFDMTVPACVSAKNERFLNQGISLLIVLGGLTCQSLTGVRPPHQEKLGSKGGRGYIFLSVLFQNLALLRSPLLLLLTKLHSYLQQLSVSHSNFAKLDVTEAPQCASYLISRCPGERTACLHTAASAA